MTRRERMAAKVEKAEWYETPYGPWILRVHDETDADTGAQLFLEWDLEWGRDSGSEWDKDEDFRWRFSVIDDGVWRECYDELDRGIGADELDTALVEARRELKETLVEWSADADDEVDEEIDED